MKSFSLLGVASAVLSVSSLALSVTNEKGRLPNEYETTVGPNLGMAGGGMAAVSGISSVKLNPAMLPLEKHYRVSAAYNWPTFGREFYQAGVMDSTTSSIAAGLSYTGAERDYESPFDINDQSLSDTEEEFFNRRYDSPIKKRVTVGFAQAFTKISLGVSGQLVEAYDVANKQAEKLTTGYTLGFGAAGLLTPQLRVAVSAENLANDRIKDYAPRTYRAGVAYLINKYFSAHLDYRDRERIFQESTVSGPLDPTRPPEKEVTLKSEKMAIASLMTTIYDVLRLYGGYGHGVDEFERRSVSGGVSLVNNKFSLGYLVSRPYLSDKKIQQAINFGVDISM